MKKYNPSTIEKKWQRYWEQKKLHTTKDKVRGKENFYLLFEFPYPSGNLHIGHWYAFSVPDILSRYLRMKGFNVMYPIGFDAFGLPAENAAIERNLQPEDWTDQNIAYMSKQLWSMGATLDWSREVRTTDPEYYKWTQWIFLQFYKKGLAYRKKQPVNWCPKDQTVLADEQVITGKCERCGSEVIKRELEQWFFKITEYAERLLRNLEKLDWSEKVKIAQTNWIGLSEGAEVAFKVKDSKFVVSTFTTRPDTLFGATYVVLAPEHPLIHKLESKIQNLEEVKGYIEVTKKKTERMRQEDVIEKTGVELKGISVINPVNQKDIPTWIADYVLAHYGTGAIMAVPAHDERDYQFARQFNLPIMPVIESEPEGNLITVEIDDFDDSDAANVLRDLGSSHEHSTPSVRIYQVPFTEAEAIVSVLKKTGIGQKSDYGKIKQGKGFILTKDGDLNFLSVFAGDGVHINSDFLDGLRNDKAIEKIIIWLEKYDLGVHKKTYRLHDWVISRQRYWGVPIPMIHCGKCGYQPVPEEELPIKLPELDDYRPTSDGRSPLAKAEEWVKTKCPNCGRDAERETDTMDTFVDSSWYFLRYADPKNKNVFADKAKMKLWLPVDLYVGGAEHNTMHLLYSRFFTKALFDLGLIDFDEPFTVRKNHGVILGADSQKMSKSRGNVVDPDDLIKKYGADTVRMYLAFMGPYDQGGPWNPGGIMGVYRFLNRVWNLYKSQFQNPKSQTNPKSKRDSKLETSLHKAIKKIGEDIASFKFNTAVSELMKLLNEFEKRRADGRSFELFLKLLSPFAPHLTEEIWQDILGHKKSIHLEKWPDYDEKLIAEELVSVVVQVEGKARSVILLPAGSSEEAARKLALANEKVKKYLAGHKIKRVVFVKNRLINFVI